MTGPIWRLVPILAVLLLALTYLVITGVLVFAFRKLEARIPARLG